MRTTSGRRNLFLVLCCVFGVQTALVYLDDTGRTTPPLSEKAQIGWEVWHANNCQSCHQIYGFGGFLGPDLTNAHGRLAPERLHSILTEGAGVMPAFGLTAEEIDGFTAFLEELDATGIGQLRLVETPPPAELLDEIVEKIAAESPLDPEARLGRAVTSEKKCIACHLPFRQSTHRAPDMRTMVSRLTGPGVLSTLEHGRSEKGMPPFLLDAAQQRGMIAFLTWMEKNGDALGVAFEAAAKTGREDASIPWFEYPR